MDKRRKRNHEQDAHLVRDLFEAIAESRLSLTEAVKQMRKVSRLTQPEFARHRKVSLKTLKDIESGRGNPTVETLNRIGAVFGLEVSFVTTQHFGKPDYLELACISANVSHKTNLDRMKLIEILSTGEVEKRFAPHLRVIYDEAPDEVFRGMVGQIRRRQRIDPDQLEANVRKIGREIHAMREF